MTETKKRLTLMRHAKSGWDSSAPTDFDRPLNNRGYHDALAMGQWLYAQSFQPDLIICSPAIRAFTTAQIVARCINYEMNAIQTEPSIYEAEGSTLLHLCQSLPAEKNHIMLIGHNPGFTLLAKYLTGDAVGAMSTASIVHLKCLAGDWSCLHSNTANLIWHQYPEKK